MKSAHRWQILIGSVALLHVGIFWWLEKPAPKTTTLQRPAALASIVPSSSASTGTLEEQLALFDLQPLFFPTEHNAWTGDLPSALRKHSVEVFGLFDPQLSFSAERLNLSVPLTVAVPETPQEAIQETGSATFDAFGRANRLILPLPQQQAAIAVSSAQTGDLVFSQAVSQGLETLSERNWAPVTFFVAANNAGILGDLSIESSSGSSETDEEVRRFLMQTFRLGERLAPGFYRVCVGP